MRSVCGDVDGRAPSGSLLDAAKDEFQFALKDRECLLKVMAMRWRPSAWRNMHIDEAVPSRSVFPGKKDGVGVAHQPDVSRTSGRVRLRNCQVAAQVVCRDRCWLRGLF